MNAQIQSGARLGRYEIRSHIGAGGMGDVYQARDTELDRLVALKVLPSEVASDQQRMRRFIQEAKAASSLNHQNIITIYEVGETDTTRFIATEFIDGVTLRQQLKRRRLSVGETLDIGIQIATGLAAAHEAGIVHRDVKPENVMLRNRDGFVKLLDFGLVKLTESITTTDAEAPTRALVNTDAGTVMGTVIYMSPEQARGKPVDERTDIWSLGVILYEMVTGIAPFGGDSSADVIASIVRSNPDPITLRSPETPSKLEEIILKALEKDREERYQTVKDLLVDLRKLKKRIDFETETERSFTPDRDHLSKSLPGTVTSAGSQTASIDSVRPTSSAEYLVSEIKRHKSGLLLLAIVIPVILGAAGLFLIKYLRKEEPVAKPQMKINKLTSGGRVNGLEIDGSTSISADGKYVVYTLLDAGKVSIWVRQISTGSDVQIVPPGNLRNGGTTISNDGEFVFFIGINSENPHGSLFQVPLLGGASRKVLAEVRSPISFSPDGTQFAFVREHEDETALMIANTDGTGERTLSSRQGNDWFSSNGPAWSPDGKTIAVAIGTDTGGTSMTVGGFSVTDGAHRSLCQRQWNGDLRRVLWLKDGSGLITPIQDTTQGTQLWFISQPDGEPSRITNDLNGYGSVSLGISSDGNTIVTVQSVPDYQIWTTKLGTTEPPVQITHGEIDGFLGVDWASDDQIVYLTRTGEAVELVAVKADGSGMRTVLRENNVQMTEPSVSPDGQTIFFASMRSGAPHIWRVQIDGTGLRQLTSGDFADFAPRVSPDGKWILFASLRTGTVLLWKVPSEGGEAVRVTENTTSFGTYSPDGKMIGVVQVVRGATPPWQLGIIPNDGSTQAKFITRPSHLVLRPGVKFSADSRSMLLRSDQGGVGNVWSLPIDGSAPKPLTNFNSKLITWFALSPDGKQLVASRGTSVLDLVLIKDFR